MTLPTDSDQRHVPSGQQTHQSSRRHWLLQAGAGLLAGDALGAFVSAGGGAGALASQALTVAQPLEAGEVGPNAGKVDPKRVRGLLLGTLIGDAMGGPIEFQPTAKAQALPQPTKAWIPGEKIDAQQIEAAHQRFVLRSYADLRPVPESYGHWTPQAAPGTLTDDSRHKMVLMHMLRQAEESNTWPLSGKHFAQAYLDWADRPEIADRPGYPALAVDWLLEMQLSARWLLGERDPKLALPCERMWSGLPTCCGQMAFPPLAAIYAGRPLDAYLATYELAFIDNSFARDMNSALIAGLATALVSTLDAAHPEDAWQRIWDSMHWCDPYRYAQVPWTERSSDRWLNVALMHAKEAQAEPAELYRRLSDDFRYTTKWEAQVPFTVMFSCLALCQYDPIAAMQLALEWGEDTDSDAQLLGALVGALHGPDIFPADVQATVAERLEQDYGESLDAWVDLLVNLQGRSLTQPLISAASS